MATHVYDDPNAHSTKTVALEGPVARCATRVELVDGTDKLSLVYTDLDDLEETVALLLEARANHIAALSDHCELVQVTALEAGDLVVLDGDLVMVDRIVLTGEEVMVRYATRYAGMFDGSAGTIVARTLPNGHRVKRLTTAPFLAVV